MSELINNREHRKQIIKGILLDLHKGKSVEEVKPRFDSVAAEYIAIRDASGEFLGVLEATQDIKPLQAITGEKRIMD